MIMIYFSHPICQKHNNGGDHPESAQRVARIEDALIFNRLLDFVLMPEPRKATDEDVLRVHSSALWESLKNAQDPDEIVMLDSETAIAPDSIEAALTASGAVLDSVDALMNQKATTAFCNIRPPGHHAEVNRSMGFCLINHVAIGAAYAIEKYHLQRVAILDFDVHHGNGTETYAEIEPKVLFCSSFENDIYPFSEPSSRFENIIKMPLARGSHDEQFLSVWRETVWPKLRDYQPELIILSAGFDAHRWDLMANLDVSTQAFEQWTHEIREIADEVCQGRVISVLEGGYDIRALTDSVVAHFRALANL